MLKVANVTLPGNIVLSPMAGVTDAPFRKIAKQNGADYCISEMITSQNNLWHTNKTQLRLKDNWESDLKIIQIAGASAQVVAEAALRCESLGADLIEINMGCPAKKVCNVLAGSALLKNPTLVKEILENTVKAVSIPVILKTRLGYDHDNYNILTIAKIAQDAGIKSIAIHGRTRSDLYNGNATYDLVAQVKQNVEMVVFANGDIESPEKAKFVLDYTKADGLYIGRGALGKPWLFNQIKQYLKTGTYEIEVGFDYLKATIIEHLGYIYQHYGEVMGCRMARKHVKWYLQNLQDPSSNINISTIIAEFNLLETSLSQLEFIDSICSHRDNS